MFKGRDLPRRKRLDEKYAVGNDGLVYSDGIPLKAVGGTWVSIRGERRSVAYLVARAFVPNAEGREFVVHKNGDPTDNRAENLEWSDTKEKGRKRGPKSRALRFGQYSREGELVAVWYDVAEAAKGSGVKAGCIWSALQRGGRSGGWKWLYF